MTIRSVNPATGDTLATFEEMSDGEVDRVLSLVANASSPWGTAPVPRRAAVLSAAADLLEREQDDLGRLMTLEMGKTHRSAVAEAAKCALACRYYAEHAERFLTPEAVLREDGDEGEVWFLPLGTVLAIMPWNFPFWQVIRFAAPALAAGNTAVLKHASNVPQCALAMENLFRRAGAPDGVFRALLIGAERVEGIIADQRVHAVTLTGSEPAGRAVAAAAGKHLKKSVLELGGSDPFIVTASADLAAAVETAVSARIINNGQSCIAAKRFIVVEPLAAEFEQRFVERMRQLRVGDPFDESTDVGPLATAAILSDLDAQVRETVSRGARLVTGGRIMSGPGNFYEPTVLADIPRGSPAAEQELFGPVAALFTARDTNHAIAIANDSAFGLGASVWTTDRAEADRFSHELQTGTVAVNTMVASDPRFPFGGVKASGYGRELGIWGMREFQNVKAVRRRGLRS